MVTGNENGYFKLQLGIVQWVGLVLYLTAVNESVRP